MKNIIIYLLVFSFVLSSCDPDVAGEGITLPAMEFGFKISPDTAYIKLGDTITLKSSISSTLSNGVKIEDGEATIDLFIGYANQIPITTFSFEAAIPNEYLNVYASKGGINISETTGKVTNIYALPYGDSIQVEIAFVPLKKGTYCFQVQSMFYEGSKGKTRTQPTFDVKDFNWSLWQKEPQPNPNDGIYNRTYYFAVTD